MKCILCEQEATTRIVIHISRENFRDSEGMDFCNACTLQLLTAMQTVIKVK